MVTSSVSGEGKTYIAENLGIVFAKSGKKTLLIGLSAGQGAGKTTVIRSITGLLDVQNGDITKGSISVDGEDITNLNPSKIVEKGIAQVLEGRRIFSELTVIENLRLGGHTNSNDIKDNIESINSPPLEITI